MFVLREFALAGCAGGNSRFTPLCFEGEPMWRSSSLGCLLLALIFCCWVVAGARRRVPRSHIDDDAGDDEELDENRDEVNQSKWDAEAEHHPMSVTDFLREPTRSELSLRERKLLASSELTAATILEQHHYYFAGATRSFAKEVMAYVTPWNARGYEISLLMKNRLDIVSPVWFRIVRSTKTDEIEVDGVGDMNKEWLNQMKTSSCTVEDRNAELCAIHKVKIVPRVKLETELRTDDDIVATTRLLRFLQEKYAFDGYTLEMNLNLIEKVIQFTLVLKESYGMFVVLVAPSVQVPDGEAGVKMRGVLDAMTRYVDRVSVMTYDANQAQEGPNAPLQWVKQVLSSMGHNAEMRRKLLVGLPYYGWRGREDMTGEKMIVWMASSAQQGNDVRVAWDADAAEHVFTEVGPDNRVMRRCYYPTPLFLQRRLRLADQQGLAGVAIWELGQGMAAFIDLF